jgi:hypothetical protein
MGDTDMAALKPAIKRKRKLAAKPRPPKMRPPDGPDYNDEVTQKTIDALNKLISDDEFGEHKPISGPAW